jgi:hypothetical protein
MTLGAVLASLSHRLDRIESQLGITQPQAGAPAPTPPPATAAAPQPGTAPPPQRPKLPLPEVRGVTVDASQARSGTGNLLGSIAVVCFVLAGIFLVKLAIDAGLLTPERQIGLATLFGFTLIGGGFLLRSRDEEYASLLPASGVVVLYLAAYGARLIYHLIDLEVAALSAAAVTGLGLWLFTSFRHDFFAIACALGSYLFPLLMTEYRSDYGLLSTYLLMWGFAFSFISVFIETRALPLLAAYLGLGIGAAFGAASGDPSVWRLAVAVQLIQFCFFAAGVTWYSVRNRVPLTSTEVGSYFLVLIFFYATESLLLHKISPELAPWIELGTALALILLYRLARRLLPGEQLHSKWLVTEFGAIVLFHAGYLQLLPAEAKGPLFLALLFIFPIVGATMGGGKLRLERYPVSLLLLLFVLAIEYGKILVGSEPRTTEMTVLFGLACAAGIIWVRERTARASEELGYVMLTFAHLQAVVALYRLSHSSGSFAVSLAWGGYAALVLALASLKKDAVMGRSSVVVLLFAAGKALLYDVSSAAPVVRILCLGLTGALLFLSGFLFRRMSTWKT